jgi:histidinol-phosphate aminotransferase
MVRLIKEGHNIAISRTFSKIYGMAGQRVGYIIADPEIIRTINRNGTGEFSTAMAGVSGAIVCYNDENFLKYSKSKINEAKEMVIEVAKSNGLETLPSQTNFIYVNLGNINADTFRDEMRKQNIIIAGKYGKHTNWSRVSMGKIEDIQRYVDAFPVVLDHLTI